MERPSKRRRLYQRDELQRARRSFPEVRRPEANSALLNEDKSHANKISLLQAKLHGVLNDLKQPEASEDEIQKIHPRQINPNPVSAVTQPIATAVESVVRVIIDNPSGSSIGDVLVPAQSSVFTFDGFGPVTLPHNAGSPTSSTQPPARFASQSAYITPGPQSQAPQSTQQSAPTSADQSPSRPSEAPPASVSALTNSPTSQSPMTISVPGSSSQVVLSSPPTTPVPSSPSTSLSSTSATNTGSTTSYFSLSSSTSASTSSQTTDIPNPNQTPTNTPVAASTSSNISMTSFTSSQTSTGSRGPTSLTLATPISNSTLITSTRTSSSSSSGTGTISSTSSQETSTMTNSSSIIITSSTSSTSSRSSTLSSSSSASTTSGTGVIPGGIGGGSGSSSTGTAPSSTASPGTGSGGSSAPSTPTVVGGVVGGVAGLTIILLLLLILFRWRRRKTAGRRNISPPMTQTIPPTSGAPSGTVTERSSNVPFAAAGIFKRMRPRSSATAATTETAPSERGFQNFGGRKIESVLESGGDGFGNPGPSGSTSPRPVRGYSGAPAAGLAPNFRPASPQTPLSETSFYRDSQGFYGGAPEPESSSNPSSMYGRPDSPPPRSPDRGPVIASGSPLAHLGSQAQRDQEVAFMRPGPARTPITNQPGFSSLRPPTGRGTPPPRPLPPVGSSPNPRDGVGRSHPSFDGSRGSRFTEEIVPP